jgi:hypothetical protein
MLDCQFVNSVFLLNRQRKNLLCDTIGCDNEASTHESFDIQPDTNKIFQPFSDGQLIDILTVRNNDLILKQY